MRVFNMKFSRKGTVRLEVDPASFCTKFSQASSDSEFS